MALVTLGPRSPWFTRGLRRSWAAREAAGWVTPPPTPHFFQRRKWRSGGRELPRGSQGVGRWTSLRRACAQVAVGPQGLESMLATLALPKCGFLRNWEASALAPMAEAHRLGRSRAALARAPYPGDPGGPEACCL